MKKLILLLAIIIIIIGATPLVGGYIFKGDFDKFITALNQDTNTQARVVEYKSGWVSSHAKVIIEPRETGRSMPGFAKPQIVLDQEICHGPFIFDKEYGFTIAEGVVHSQVHLQPFEMLIGVPQDKGMMQVSTLVNYNNTYVSQFSSPPLTKAVPEKFTFKWEGFKGSANIDMANDKIDKVTTKVDMGPVDVNIANGSYEVKIAGATGENMMKSSSVPGLWNSNHSDKIGTITYSVSGKDMFMMNSTKAMVNTKIDNKNLFDMDMNINIDRMNFTDQIEIKPVAFNVTINDLSGAELAKIMRTPSMDRSSSENLFPKVVTPTSNVKSDLKVETSRGHLMVTANVDWKGQSVANAEEMRNKTNVMVNLRISQNLLNYITGIVDSMRPAPSTTSSNSTDTKSMQDEIKSYIDKGYLTQDKDDYISQIMMSQGKVTINGKDYVPETSDTSGTSTSTDTTATPAPSDSTTTAPSDTSTPSNDSTTTTPSDTSTPSNDSTTTAPSDTSTPSNDSTTTAPSDDSTSAAPGAAAPIPPASEEAKPVGKEMPPVVTPPKTIETPKADVPIEGKPFTIEQDPRNQT